MIIFPFAKDIVKIEIVTCGERTFPVGREMEETDSSIKDLSHTLPPRCSRCDVIEWQNDQLKTELVF